MRKGNILICAWIVFTLTSTPFSLSWGRSKARGQAGGTVVSGITRGTVLSNGDVVTYISGVKTQSYGKRVQSHPSYGKAGSRPHKRHYNRSYKKPSFHEKVNKYGYNYRAYESKAYSHKKSGYHRSSKRDHNRRSGYHSYKRGGRKSSHAGRARAGGYSRRR